MSSIDERVVQMKFDNSQFQKGVSDTNNSLASLKQGLNLSGATAGLNELQAVGSRFSLAGMAAGVDTIASKFSALGILGITALVNIGNQAINTGINIAKSLTIGPIAEGFSDYNAKLSSVQTIMNATGSSIEVVSGYFGELDTYADKTIYNLTDMTGAFAKFTNAGVDMDKSVPAIKGIANMVALAGQDAGAASVAMYNLSQSIAGGFLTTTDYRSLNLANVATKEWKGQMVDAAVAAGKLKKTGDGLYEYPGAKKAATEAELFNDHLAEGWASTDVLMQVLGDYGNTQTDIGKKAQAAAQDVKSFGMMMETLKAGVGTGWTDTFEILVGNLHEAKALFTPLTNEIGGFLTEFDEARNKLLGDWKALGGRDDVIETFKSGFQSLFAVINPIKEAFREIFPATTGQDLKNITGAVREFVAGLKPSEETIANIKSTAKGLFAVLDIGRMIIMGVIGVIARFVGSISGAGGGILEVTGNIGDFLVRVRDAIKNGEGLTNFFKKLDDILRVAGDSIKRAGEWLGNLFNGVEKIDTSGAVTMLTDVKNAVKPLEASADHVRTAWEKLGNFFKGVFEFLRPLGEKIGEWVRGVGDTMSDAVGNMDWSLVLDGINAGLFAGLILLIRKFFMGGFQDAADGGGIIQHIKDVFGGMTDTLGQMQNTLKAGTLILIAGAIALLAGSAVALASVDSGKLTAALGAMAVMMVQLVTAMAIFDRLNPTSSIGTMVGMGTAMILLATAIRILAESVEALSKLSWEELLKGLVGVTVLLGGIAAAMKIMGPQTGKMISTGIGLMAIAVAIKILASAVSDLSGHSWEELAKGLVGVGVLLGALALFTKFAKVSKGAMGSGVGLLLLGVAIKILASAVGDFAAMDVATIQQGLGALTGVLAMLAIFSRVVNPSGMVSMGVAMVILGGAMKIMASAISDLGSIPMDTLTVGLFAMAAALAVIAATMSMMPKNMLVTAGALVIVAGALLILANVLKQLGGMTMDEIGQGFIALAAGLTVIAIALNMMTGALSGAFALIVAAGALAILTPVLMALGSMSLLEIATGLGVIAATFVILGVAALILTPVIPALMGLGIAIALLGAGAALVGVGLLAFSAGLTALSLAGAAGTAALVTMVMALAAMLPAIMVQVGLALVAFAQVIIDSAPKFGEAITVVLLTLLNIINAIAPQIVSTLWNLVVLMVEALVRGIPYLVDAGMRLIIGILKGIGDNIGKIVDEGARIIVEFLNGISRNLPQIIQAGINLIISFVNGLADGIRNNQSRMESAGRNLAGAIIDGMTSGIRNGIHLVAQAAGNVAQSALDTVKSWLGIKSPSKEFKKLGMYSSQGLAIGLTEYSGVVDKAAAGVGKSAISTLKMTMSNMSDMVNDEMDYNPTIKPVLDLSDIQNKSRQLGGLLTPPKLVVDGTYAKATSLVERERATREASSENEAATQTSTGDQYIFNQTNNSPKAISAAEAYRGTKNLISMAKDKKKGAPTK